MTKVFKALLAMAALAVLAAFLELLATWAREDPWDQLARPDSREQPGFRVDRDRQEQQARADHPARWVPRANREPPAHLANRVRADPSVLPDHLVARVRRVR